MSNFPMLFPQRAVVSISMVAAVASASVPAVAQPAAAALQLGASAVQAGVAVAQPGVAVAQPDAAAPRRDTNAAADNEIDRLVQEALDSRHAAEWRRLGDFVLRETLAVAVDAPSDSPLAGFRRTREYEWYVRDGRAVRSPVRVDGVAIGEARRRGYERDWLREEQRRRASPEAGDSDPDPEPRFVTDFHYFLESELKPGDCYLVRREVAARRDVVRLECYPTGILAERAAHPIERGIRKTSTLTLWVDAEARRIVKYTFENAGLDFLPLQRLVRANGFLASLEMAPVGGVWMPARMTLAADITTARGEIDVTVTQRFFEYREAETGARLVDPARFR